MTSLGVWLARHGLEGLEPTLSANEIDLDILFDLTDEDLREIGLSLGARKRIRAAIDAGPDAGADPVARAPRITGKDAERRQLTTMFVDLVGSTRLSSGMDPEDMRELITGYQNAVAGVVTRYEGQVAKYMGDGVLCYFGWPHAHEDDAKRAARSGLEIIEAVRGIRTPDDRPLSVRVGIATGLVVVGDLVGKGAAQEEAVVGDTPNLAARLQQAANADEVLIAESTRQLLAGDFETAPVDALDVKGLDGPLSAWHVIAERSLASRFEVRTSTPAIPMIGREHELGLILERWDRACRGEGQVTVLTGEAGIGKSRLTRGVIDAIGGVEHYRISYHCSPYHTDSSFHPVVQQLLHAIGFSEAASTDEKLAMLENTLRAADPKIIAELLRIDGRDRYGPLDLTPQQIRNRIMDATSEEIRALSREKPVLLVVEDAHWIDASTLASLEACLDKIADERVLILITARPTFEHGFGGHPIVTKLTLNRLGSQQTASVLSKITGGKALPAELVAEIVARTDGVPLFIEELTKTIIESGDLVETDTAYELERPLSRIAIPATLHDSLMARIDRLQPVKEIAQMAACIGREFKRSVLHEIARVDDAVLDDALGQLEASELLFRRGIGAGASYVFKHALVRDVAYESLLKRRRQEIHHRLVDVLEADEAAPPELKAHHATEAGLAEKATLLWRVAGTAAQARPAYDEAANHLKMALSTVQELLDQPEWRERELELLVQLAQIYVAKEGYASEEASEAFRKALERIDAASTAELRVAIIYGLWITPYIGGRLHEALAQADRLVEEIADEAEPIPRLIARRMRAANLISLGRSPEALSDLDLAYELYQSAQITDFASRFAQDPGVQIWCYRLLALWICGRQDEALEIADRSMERARSLGHANTLCYASLHDMALSIWRGDIERIRAVNDQMRRVGEDHDMALWKLYADVHDAVVDCMQDRPGAPERLDEILEKYRASGCGLWTAFYRSEQAKSRLRTGDRDGARNTVERALAEIDQSGEVWVAPELHRIAGDVEFHQGRPAEARERYQRAIALARSQGARSLEDRAQLSLQRAEAD